MNTIIDKHRTKKEMIQEMKYLREQVAELQQREHEFKAVIASLQGSVDKYRTIADGTYDWEFWQSPGGEFCYTSPSCERITGYTASDFAADPALFLRIIHKDDMPWVAEHLNRHRAEKGYCQIEFRLIHKDGTIRRVSLAFQSVYDNDGMFKGIRGSNREVAEAPH